MFKTLINIFRVPELRNKVLFTLFMLAIYRIGYSVPLPGVDQDAMAKIAEQQQQGDSSAAGRLAAYMSLFSGGNLSQSTVFALGVMPYISASIIFQLLATVVPSLEKLQKEGETGRKKIQEWTRYATVPLCMLQAMFIIKGYLLNSQNVLVQRVFVTHLHGTRKHRPFERQQALAGFRADAQHAAALPQRFVLRVEERVLLQAARSKRGCPRRQDGGTRVIRTGKPQLDFPLDH